ncbi:MAG: (2Fe-2S)-binding protein [Thermodesulfobacteriota bacterium]
MKIPICLVVNGERHELEAGPQETLVEILRERLHLTGTKEGCGIGDCGTCIVLMDGVPVNSCLVLAGDLQGRQVLTIEGLDEDGKLHPLQESFLEKGAVQCGFCTPAMILSAKSLLDRDPAAGEEEIKRALSGSLCRCGSYKKIVEAVQAAGEKMGGKRQ